MRPRYEWYQTSSHVILTIFVKNIKNENIQLNATSEHISLKMLLNSPDAFNLELELAQPILNNKIQITIMSMKVEIQMEKLIQGKSWPSLEKSETSVEILNTSEPSPHHRSPTPKDWNELEKLVSMEEEQVKPSGDQDVMEFFQKLYKNSPDEVKRAMVKSFSESKGTCLSTNWEEVGSKTVEPYEQSSKSVEPYEQSSKKGATS
jgi:suppressor of G2 allele of SKP1